MTTDNFIDKIAPNSRIAKHISDVLVAKYNPNSIINVTFDHLRDVLEGRVNIVDATNPVTGLIECSALNTAAAIIDNETNTRKQYPSLAQTEEDLYLHMSDKDYIDRFASPVNTVFTIAILKDELLNSLVEEPLTGIKKVTIPRNTIFTVADTVFSMQYPIDIKQLLHGGLEITYDTSILSPLQVLSTNVVNWSTKKLTLTQQEWVFIEIDVQQFDIASYTTNVSATTGLTKTFNYTDKFCYARVYQKSIATAGKWVEIATTHSGQVYDINTPTVNLKVLTGQLVVAVPQIYLNTNKIRGDLRVDIYQTKGPVNIATSNYTPDAFSLEWKAIDKVENTIYTSPLTVIRSIMSYSDRHITGGKDALSFEDLRSRVIRNATGVKQLPITNVQISATLENEGYEVVKNTDIVTNRVFLATKQLPRPFDERLITAAATSIETLVVSMADAVNHPLVKNNGNRIALVPEIVYKNDNGIISIVPIDEVNSIKATVPEIQAGVVTNGNYLYSPFHYVLDNTKPEFEVRPYYLNDPKTKFVTFISQNDTTMLQVNTKSHSLIKTDTGYTLRVVTRGNSTYKAISDSSVHAQLSFIPVGESNRAYLNGVFVGKDSNDDKVFEFTINSNTDIDDNDNLFLDSFLMFDLEPKKLRSKLENSFDIFYTTTESMSSGWSPSSIDGALGNFLLPEMTTGITNDRIDIVFGYSLKTLWARSRSSIISEVYETYSTDVPLLYDGPVYKKDPITGLDFTIDASGAPVFEVLYRAGDPVVDTNGIPVIKFKAGDLVLQSNGKPKAVGPASISREVDIMFVEGVYYFATDTASETYRTEITNAVVQWLIGDLTRLSTQLLDETKIYFYPKTNMGTIRVMVENGQTVSIDAGHSFNVKLYVNSQVYVNQELRENLTTNTVRVIDNCLKKTMVSVDDIISSLRAALSGDILSVDITGLGRDGKYNAFTILDDGDRASLKKSLVALPNNKLIVTEDVRVDFIEHQLSE